MTRLALLALVLVAIAGGLFALAPVLISPDLAQRRLAEQITLWTGRPVTFTGKPTVSLHPQLTITLAGVVIGDVDDAEPPLVTMDSLRGTVSLLPLLFGRVEVSEFEMIRPKVDLRVDADGRANWAELGGTLGARIAAAEHREDAEPLPGALRLGRLIVADGEVTYRNAVSGVSTAFHKVSLDASWPTTSRAATASARFTWREEEVEAHGSVADPLALLGGQVTSARLTVASLPIHLSFTGNAFRADGYQLRGDLEVTTPSVRALASWAGAPMQPGASLGAGSARGEANLRAGKIAFSNVTVSLDGNTGTGVLSADLFRERPLVQGTLAFETLDLSTYLDTIGSGIRAASRWAEAPIVLPVLNGLDADIRLSAQTVVLGAQRLSSAAASAAIKEGRVSVNLGDADLYGGRLQAALTADIRPEHIEGSLRASIKRLPLSDALDGLFGADGVSGTANLALEATGAGATLGELISSLEGTIAGRFTDLSFQGVDLAGAIGPARSFPASLFRLGGSSTDFTSAEAQLHFDRGQLRADRVTATARHARVEAVGWASLFQPTLSLVGSLISDTGGSAQDLPFMVFGTWAGLAVEPDPNRTIQTIAPPPFPLPIPEAIAAPVPALE